MRWGTKGGASLPQIELDATRRWVTLRGVHPDFARAAARAEQSQDTSRL